MKMPTILQRKKLSASTARRSRGLGMPDAMAYEEMSEPNMKLSRALLIVLVLHIVAVAGIIAFNTIKTREVLTANPPATPARRLVPARCSQPVQLRQREQSGRSCRSHIMAADVRLLLRSARSQGAISRVRARSRAAAGQSRRVPAVSSHRQMRAARSRSARS